MKNLEASGRKIKMARRTTFGPNYILEAFLLGPIDSRTGMLINLIDIDKILKAVVTTVDVKQEGALLAKNLFASISSLLPKTFPGLDLQLAKIRLAISEDKVIEVGP
jgi:hypothetical protein